MYLEQAQTKACAIYFLSAVSISKCLVENMQGSIVLSVVSNQSAPPKKWWSQTGSNRRPEACKATALPTELWPRIVRTNVLLFEYACYQIGVGGPGKT